MSSWLRTFDLGGDYLRLLPHRPQVIQDDFLSFSSRSIEMGLYSFSLFNLRHAAAPLFIPDYIVLICFLTRLQTLPSNTDNKNIRVTTAV
jgi:hypothetical protein